MNRNDYVFKDTADNILIMNNLIRHNQPKRKGKRVRKDVISIWIKALRSGKYTKKTWGLKSKSVDNQFNVIGVLCEVTKDITGGHWERSKFKLGDKLDDWMKQTCAGMPCFVSDMLGTPRLWHYYPIEGGVSNQFYKLNEHYSFEEMADIIESEYL